MIKIDDIIGDRVFISFRDPKKLQSIAINIENGHFIVKGFDHIGIWLEHPGLVMIKTEDSKGKPIQKEKQVKENIDAVFLAGWDNIDTIMHYPNRENFDFPNEFDKDMGF